MTRFSAMSHRFDVVVRPLSDRLLTVKSGIFTRRDYDQKLIYDFVDLAWAETAALRANPPSKRNHDLHEWCINVQSVGYTGVLTTMIELTEPGFCADCPEALRSFPERRWRNARALINADVVPLADGGKCDAEDREKWRLN